MEWEPDGRSNTAGKPVREEGGLVQGEGTYSWGTHTKGSCAHPHVSSRGTGPGVCFEQKYNSWSWMSCGYSCGPLDTAAPHGKEIKSRGQWMAWSPGPDDHPEYNARWCPPQDSRGWYRKHKAHAAQLARPGIDKAPALPRQVHREASYWVPSHGSIVAKRIADCSFLSPGLAGPRVAPSVAGTRGPAASA